MGKNRDDLIRDKLKKVQLEILDELHSYCIANKIHYSLAYGTLLGAIRHKGYIPWDDDIDVMMPRSEYNRFIRNYHSDSYFVQNVLNDPGYQHLFSKLMKKHTIYVEKGAENMSYEKGVFIDVFPIDSIKKDLFNYYRIKIILQLLHILYAKGGVCHKISSGILRTCVNMVFRDRLYWIKKFTAIVGNSHGDVLINWHASIRRLIEIGPAEMFEHYLLTEFEGKQYFIIKEYDRFLKVFYGDYMKLPPVEKRKGGHPYSEIRFG